MSKDVTAVFVQGQAHFAAKKYQQAAEAFAEAVRLAPEEADYHAHLAEALVEQRPPKLEEAVESASQAVKLDPSCLLAYIVRGRARNRLGQRDGALADLDEALRLDPDSGPAHFCKSIVHNKAGEWQTAIEELNRAILLLDTDRRLHSDALARRGWAYYRLGDASRAKAEANEAIRVDPDNWLPLYYKGIYNYDEQRWGYAIEDFSKALVLLAEDDFNRSHVLDYRGWAHLQQGDNERALVDANEAIRLDPENDDAYALRGDLHLKGKRWREAVEDYTQSIRHQEVDDESVLRARHGERAKAYKQLKDLENYLVDYARSLSPGSWPVWSGGNERFAPFYTCLDRFFKDRMMAQLEASEERLVTYWPAFFLWDKGERTRQDVLGSHRVYTFQQGTFGTGMVCLTDKSVHLVALLWLTKRFPLVSRGVIDTLLGSLAQEMDNRQPIQDDVLWKIPHQDILGAQLADDGRGNRRIHLVSVAQQWEIYEHFGNQCQEILVGLNMARSGKLARIWAKPADQTEIPGQPSAKILELLEKLGALKAAGILTDSEFQAKKMELLARL